MLKMFFNFLKFFVRDKIFPSAIFYPMFLPVQTFVKHNCWRRKSASRFAEYLFPQAGTPQWLYEIHTEFLLLK
jgi:hypothetical protein